MTRRTARYDAETGRFYLTCHYKDPVLARVRRFEGRRWHKAIKAWSVPASLRAWRAVQEWGFDLLAFGGGQEYVRTAFNGPQPSDAVSAPNLFTFQAEDVGWAKRRRYVLIANPPGTGKTREAIEWAAHHHRVLVVCPKVAFGAWVGELGERCGISPAVRPDVMPPSGWTVVNYEWLGKLKVDGPFTLIVDEAHYCQYAKRLRTKRTLKLALAADAVCLLTGTPSKRRPIGLWPLFVMLRLRDEKEFFPWALRYTAAYDNGFGWDFTGTSHAEELRDELQHVMVRREKPADLPPKLYTTLFVEAGRATTKELATLDEAVFYQIAKQHSLLSGDGLGAVQHLRRAASRAKIDTTVEYALSVGVPENKVIIFGEFLDELRAIGEQIIAGAEDECTAVYLIGENADRRQEDIQKFWSDPTCGVALCTYTAAGVSANLQCAGTVILHDLPWTPDQLEQAEDRAQRYGQVHDHVHIVTVLTSSRVEAQMLQGLREGKAFVDVIQLPSGRKVPT